MRAMWKGSISFGLVHIPIKLFAATEDRDIHFRQLHNRCKTPVQYKKWCPRCDEAVSRDDIVRGYEWQPGQYVIVDDDDLNRLPLPSLHTIEIAQFVKTEEVDPIYFERTYYLAPQEFGEKPYKLLYQAMKETGLSALAKIAFRSKEHLSLVRCYHHVLALSLMHFPEELRATSELPSLDGVNLKTAELDMAKSLINQLHDAFRPERYHNAYGDALREYLSAKVSEKGVVETRPVRGNVVDLMEALRASLEAARDRKNPELVQGRTAGS